MVRIVGSYLSPYVRKVLACLHLKGVTYEIDPIVPFHGNDAFSRVSPLRRVPVLLDGDLTLADSTVICEYLEERYPAPALLPKGAAQRARSRWLEEYADSRLGEVLIWRFYNELVIKRYVWGEAPDQAVVDKALAEEIPSLLDYMEAQLPEAGFLFGLVHPCIADIALASFFRNAQFARYAIDADRWPKAAASITQTLSLPAFQRLVPFETVCLKTPIALQREALRAAGAPISEESFFTAEPRRGILSI